MGQGAGRVGRIELTAMLAMAMALTALGIDVMLPLFPAMRADLGLTAADSQLSGLVTAYFLGLAVGQVAYGPLADRFGRRSTLVVGFVVYGVGALAAALAPSLTWLFVARVIWGLGAAGSRVITLAIVRDIYEGDRMARAMSSIMAVFILVPVVAPSISAVVGGVIGWRWLFATCLGAAVGMWVWSRRLPETLAPEHRLPLHFGRMAQAARFVVADRTTVGYALALTLLYGSFTAWLGDAELVLGELYGFGGAFPLVFGCLAAAMGLAAFTNGRVVERFGTRRLAHGVLVAYLVIAGVLLAGSLADGQPPLWLLLPGVALLLCGHALLIPNLNTIAMHPMGAVAGTASAVIGSAQIAGGALLGAMINAAFDHTVVPLTTGFLALGVGAFTVVLWAERGRLFEPLRPRREALATDRGATG